MNKSEEYKNYIIKHCNNVRLVWTVYADVYQGIDITASIAEHDQSKFSKEEFEGYRQFFYPEENEKPNRDMFAQAWNHHQKCNPHHWEYWVMGDGVILEMSEEAILEMLCDWSAMSLQVKDTPSEYYLKARDWILLQTKTRAMIEDLLPSFDKIVEALNAK